VKRTLTGSLAHLAPSSLLRLLSATGPSGVLEISSEAGDLTLETDKGKVAAPTLDELRSVGRVLRSSSGRFRFTPREVAPIGSKVLTLAALADAAEATEDSWDGELGGDIDVGRLLAGEVAQLSRPAPVANIHVLPVEPLENPLDELLEELDQTTPGELLLTEVEVMSRDPRLWRGSLEAGWRRRGWELRTVSDVADLRLDSADVVILHQEGALARVDEERGWIESIRRAGQITPPVPVVWVGRTHDREWLHRVIEAGVAFVMPPPEAQAARSVGRFAADLATVVDRLIRTRQILASVRGPRSVYELVDTLLEDADSDQAIGSLLQLASSQLTRGAVLMVEETAIRCRAGFGYPLARGAAALPRGIAVLERAIRSGEAIRAIDPDTVAAVQLARVLGIDRLPPETVVIPLAVGATVVGLLVADREGAPLPELTEMTMLACCLGGIVVRGDH
jgi:hypothetical protein